MQRTLRDEYDKLENLLRIKGIDPDEFLNQKPNEHDEEDENEYSDECSCDECCGEDCRDENQSGEKSDETSSDQGNSESGAASTSKVENHQTSNKSSADEHNKRPGKDRLNVNRCAVIDLLANLALRFFRDLTKS
jgi:cobalamin biosynthesis protein CobT